MPDAPAVKYTRTSDGASIAYWTVGTGRPLVILGWFAFHTELSWQSHGFRSWIEQLEAKHAVSMFDWRGAGLSGSTADVSLEPAVSDLFAVVTAVAPSGCALFATHATAAIAIAFAASHPDLVSHVIFFNGYASHQEYVEATPLAETREFADSDDPRRIETYVTILRGVLLGTSPPSGEVEHIRKVMEANIARLSEVSTFGAWLQGAWQYETMHRLTEVHMPALVVQRAVQGFDLGLGRAMAAGLPVAELRAVDGDALLPYIGDVDQLVELIDRFTDDGDTSDIVPGGFQTILFTDLESSTALTQRLGDEGAQELLRGHNDAVRSALEAHDGREVKHTGDGIMASFPSAVSAVHAALAMQRDLAGGEVRVRIGLNAGEPIAEDGDFFGTAVQLAARITDRAEPGQVLVSNVVRELCAGKGFEFTSVGEATLKGFDEPVALFEVAPAS